MIRLNYLSLEKVTSRVPTNKWYWESKAENKKWVRHLKDFLFKKLKQWGVLAQHFDTKTEFNVVEFHAESLLELIQEQRIQLLREGRTPVEVILGYPQFRELTGDHRLDSYLGFTWPHQGTPSEVWGLKIRCVPYIDGVVVLPEDR